MNKLMIVILAICFISCVNAFVKRDTEQSPKTNDVVKDITDQLGKIQETLKDALRKIDTEAIKKTANEALDTLKKNIGDLQQKIEETPKN